MDASSHGLSTDVLIANSSDEPWGPGQRAGGGDLWGPGQSRHGGTAYIPDAAAPDADSPASDSPWGPGQSRHGGTAYIPDAAASAAVAGAQGGGFTEPPAVTGVIPRYQRTTRGNSRPKDVDDDGNSFVRA